MRFNKAIAVALGISMASAPVLAQSARSASPVAGSAGQVAAPQGRPTVGRDYDIEYSVFRPSNGVWYAAAIFVSILAAYLILSSSGSDRDRPTSP